MPKIEKLSSGNYRIRVSYKRSDGVFRQKSFVGSTKEEVRLLASQFTPGGDITVKKAVENYIDTREPLLSPKTISEYRKVASIRFEKLHNINCERITPKMFQSAVTEEAKKITSKGKPLAQKTLKNAVGLFGAAIKSVCPNFNYGKIIYPQKIPVKYNTPDKDILKKIYQISENTMLELPVLLASQCSLRLGEVMGLTWDNVYTDHIEICQSRMYIHGEGEIVKLPKNDTSTRSINISRSLSEKLEAKRQADGFVVACPYETIETLYSRHIRKQTGVKFHELRHAYVSHLVSIGIPMDYIKATGGWGKYSTTPDNVYKQILADKEKEYSLKAASYFDSI